MKKRFLSALITCSAIFMLTGCGDTAANTSSAAAEVSETTESNEADTTTAAADTANEAAEETAVEADSETAEAEKSFSVTYKDTVIAINAPMAEVEAALGTAGSYFESTDCAFDGVQKTYTYGSLEITTYQNGDDTDYIGTIYFLDDLVSTDEGLALFMNKEAVIEAYGTPSWEDNNEYTYELGNSKLLILFDDSSLVSSITYQTKALD